MRSGFIISLLVFYIQLLPAQSLLDDSLLTYEQEIFKCLSDTVRQQIILKKVDLYLKSGFTGSEVLSEIRRVHINELTQDVSSARFLWNGAMVAYLNGETDYASFLWSAYQRFRADTSLESRLLAVLVFKDKDSIFVNRQISWLSNRDSIFLDLHCFSRVLNYKRRHLNVYLISSAIVPGMGTAFSGHVLKGVVSVLIAAGSVYGIVRLVELGLYANAVLWGTGVGLKFYTGNLRLTHHLFYKDEARKRNELAQQCELSLQNILRNYPLNLKY